MLFSPRNTAARHVAAAIALTLLIPAGAWADCFRPRLVNDYEMLDARQLLVYESRRRVYLLELSRPVGRLSPLDAIGFESVSGSICGYGTESLLIDDGLGPRRVGIFSVRRIEEGELQALRARHGDGGIPPGLEPESTPGADIERDI